MPPDTPVRPSPKDKSTDKEGKDVVVDVEPDYTFLVVQRVSPDVPAENLALLLHTCDVVALAHDGTPESLDLMRSLLLRVPKKRMACIVVDSTSLKGHPGHSIDTSQRQQILGTDYMTAVHAIGLPAERDALGGRLVAVARVPGEYSLLSVTAKRKQQLLTAMSFVLSAALVGALSYAALHNSIRRLEIADLRADWRDWLREGLREGLREARLEARRLPASLSATVQSTIQRLLPAGSFSIGNSDSSSNAGSSNTSGGSGVQSRRS
jgi:hypothetical protein